MSFKERLKKANELAKVMDKSNVRVIKSTDADYDNVGEAAETAGTLHYFAAILRKDCTMRAVIIGSVKPVDDTKNGLKRYAVIGRDVKTNATLRNWITKFDDDVVIPSVGDAFKLPAYHLPKAHVMVSWNEDLIVAKTDDVYQSISELQAESMNSEDLHYEMVRNEAIAVTAPTAVTP